MDKELFRKAVFDVIDELHALGYDLPETLKRRDPREPGRDEKERFEDRLLMVIRRLFKKQKAAIIARLEQNFPGRKDLSPIPLDDLINGNGDDELMAQLIRVISLSAVGGVNLFSDMVSIGLDYSLIKDEALRYARDHAYDLIGLSTEGIDATTRDLVSNAITRFIETPGTTLGDITRQLEDVFSLNRAQMIAVTETTNAFAMGQQIAGEALLAQFPDVRVVKKWYTNNDDRVCPICAPLNGEEVDIKDNFSHGGANPPAHPRCRCWTHVRTRI